MTPLYHSTLSSAFPTTGRVINVELGHLVPCEVSCFQKEPRFGYRVSCGGQSYIVPPKGISPRQTCTADILICSWRSIRVCLRCPRKRLASFHVRCRVPYVPRTRFRFMCHRNDINIFFRRVARDQQPSGSRDAGFRVPSRRPCSQGSRPRLDPVFTPLPNKKGQGLRPSNAVRER